MTDLDLLRAARALIADPERWCQGWEAKPVRRNIGVNALGPAAARWCAVGAIVKVTRNKPPRDALTGFLRDVGNDLYPDASETFGTLVGINDVLGHQATLAVYDEAIRRLEGAANAS